MKSLILLVAVVLVGCGKKTPKKPQTEKSSITLAQFLKGKRIHFQLDNGAGPFWSEFATDGTIRHSDRPAGTYKVYGLKVDVRDSNGPIKKVELIFLSSEISAGDTFEAKALGGIKRVHGKVLKVEKTPVLTTKIKTLSPQVTKKPKPPKLVPSKLIADPIVEKAVRMRLASLNPGKASGFTDLADLEPYKGKLTKADLEKVTSLWLDSNQLTSVNGLEKLTQLEELFLGYNQLTDVRGLEKLTQLTELQLQKNRLPHVNGLEKLTELKKLNLDNNKLTNVKGLEKLTQLKSLFLKNNPALTKTQIDELKKALPKCRIIHNATK